MFLIEADADEGVTERMWVFVTEKVGDIDVGLLDNEPAFFELNAETYLVRLAEVPFRSEHVIDIASPPRRYANLMRRTEPTRRWPRS